MGKLTARRVETEKRKGRYFDGDGLYLQVGKTGSKSWMFRFMQNGSSHDIGLGSLEFVSLSDARTKAFENRQLLKQGIDPREHRRPTIASKAPPMLEFAEEWIARHEETWRNEKHRAQWKATLATYAWPTIGKKAVDAVTRADVLSVLQPIWTSKEETATRVLQRLSRIFTGAIAMGWRADNPAHGDVMRELLPPLPKSKRVEHHAAMAFAEVPGFMAELRQKRFVSAQALEFTILTAARTGEVTSATWDEIDLKAKTWTIPKDRMKSGRDHRVPLSRAALKVLDHLPTDDEPFLFIGGRHGRGLSNMAMLELMKAMRPGLTVHGFRSSFRDWAAERTDYPNHVVEMALAHSVGDKVEAAYRRGDLFEKRREMMAKWASFCS